ncbi:hypothetical protein E6B08_23180 [Pseudomonas putida]|uniref:Uncharacterized protein n=1 Tax=Pseudomonas putida TaxID=303 RepID=A0A4D6XGS8_PSEPU|nr:hypothetical protein [Pseudomonas putida]QCI14070.1 hypothetical protein E6B08_23180 [Pseudomonas putida]
MTGPAMLEAKKMPEREKRYLAYQRLRNLDSLTAVLMQQVAYGDLDGQGWRELCAAHRQAFEQWINHAESKSLLVDREMDPLLVTLDGIPSDKTPK